MDHVTTTPHLTVRCQFCSAWNRVDATRASSRPKCGKCGTPILLDRPVRLDDESFERTIRETTIPVLVDFYADWCGPCKMMAPFVDAVAAESIGRVLVAKLNTDAAQSVARQFDIRGIPTSIAFRDGKEVARRVGALPKAGLVELIEAALPTA